MASCATCAEDDQSKFSKRMLAGAWARKGAPVRCKSCISEAERAEAAKAAINSANKAANKAATDANVATNGTDEAAQEQCAGCSKMLAPSAFSRSQLLQKGEAKRCRACVGAAGVSVGGSSLLSEAVAAPRGAKLSVLRALPEPRPAVELARLKKIKRLRRSLLRLCAAEGGPPPILAFDRWLARSRLAEPEGADPLLPSRGDVEPGLVKDLCRGGKMDAAAAQRVAAQLAQEAAQAVVHLARAFGAGGAGGEAGGEVGGGEVGDEAGGEAGGEVIVQERGAALRLSLGGPKPYVDLTRAHYAKLRSMHAAAAAGAAGEVGGEATEAQLRARVLCVLFRYAALGAHGYQAALCADGFETLREALGCTFECFASPLNCRYPTYCSAFADTDRFFGSLGSFFSFHPTEGSFEVHPNPSPSPNPSPKPEPQPEPMAPSPSPRLTRPPLPPLPHAPRAHGGRPTPPLCPM